LIKYTEILFILLLILTIPINTQANETEKHPGIGRTILNDLDNSRRDILHIFANIEKFNTTELLSYGGMISGTVACMPFDEDFRNFTLKNHSPAADTYFNIHDEFGSVQGMSVIVGGSYLTGLIFNSEQLRVTGRLMFEALLLSGLYVQKLKTTFGRSRPFTGDPANQFNWFESDNKNLSFPSGHTTGAFAIASVFALRYDKWWSYTIGYSLATGTALARVYKNHHWLSDVFLGACIGTLSGIAVVNVEKYFNNTQQKRISRKLFIDIFPVGINFTYKL